MRYTGLGPEYTGNAFEIQGASFVEIGNLSTVCSAKRELLEYVASLKIPPLPGQAPVITMESSRQARLALSRLIFFVLEDEGSHPDEAVLCTGKPNKDRQAVLVQQGVVELLGQMLQLPFDMKHHALAEVHQGQAVVEVCQRCYRLRNYGSVEDTLRPGFSDSDLLTPQRFLVRRT